MGGVVFVDLLEELLMVVHHESLRDFRVRRNHRCLERGGGTSYATYFTAGQERHYLFDYARLRECLLNLVLQHAVRWLMLGSNNFENQLLFLGGKSLTNLSLVVPRGRVQATDGFKAEPLAARREAALIALTLKQLDGDRTVWNSRTYNKENSRRRTGLLRPDYSETSQGRRAQDSDGKLKPRNWLKP